MDFPCGSVGKESTCSARDLGSNPGLGRSSGEGKGYPLQYSGLENSKEFIVQWVAKSQTRLSNFHFHVYIYIYIYIYTHTQTQEIAKIVQGGNWPSFPQWFLLIQL